MPFIKIISEPKPRSLRKDEVLEVGKTYEMSEADCNRWIRRGVADSVDAPKSAKVDAKSDK